ncbi:patatin-like phospholipase family protein [Pyxidicoccus parkwayensis]|uniref:Patatin-like phospholipase family protein n=1 Tax=Pyxidicoccus parkwayensis TaxID=2813578 RepID=A0ABX7PA87_9BACT|nr:patatin-like phospholipase family protein [Pyxidicoccus parkwaysis]QSQ27374.1 patatin-like phospholipase family protein [Pyxidicoccus parkwaysis]
MLLKERFQINRPLEELELNLVRAAMASPHLLDAREEAILRTALSLARLYKVQHGELDVGVGALLTPFREEVERRLTPVLGGSRPPTRDRLVPHVRDLREHAARARDAVAKRLRERVPLEALDREIRQKELVLVAGGGGGTAFVYLGVMSLLDEHGLEPKLIAGASMGAVLAIIRARMARFDPTEMINIVRGLSFRKLFRFISTESRYGLPAALRLFLRAGLGRFFGAGPEGSGLRLKELPIPTIISVGGIRRGMLPRPLEYYERLLGTSPLGLLNPAGVARRIQAAMGAVAELFTRPEITMRLHLGADDATSEFDALDAAGFSSALPGVIHYDVLREDPRMHGLLEGLLAQHGVARLIDGGLVDNLPAKAAWKAVARGRIGTRNTLIVGLDGFAPRLATPFWLPLQRLAAMTVAPNLPYAHHIKRFSRTLSPLEVVPNVELASKALHLGRKALAEDMPFLRRMLTPLPPVL